MLDRILSFLVVMSSSVFALDVYPPCSNLLTMGTVPCKEKPSLRFHFDAATLTCMAFQYTGCGGNDNNFETENSCYTQCLPEDHMSCPAASKPLPKPESCQEDSECGPTGYCSYGNGFGLCCETKIRDKVHSDYNPTCPKGKNVYKFVEGGINATLIGKTCKSNFCPTGATCVDGNYLAACCK